MKQTFLDFEQPIAELQQKIEELRFVHDDSAVDISDEISRLTKKSQQLAKEIYGKLSAWQIAQVVAQTSPVPRERAKVSSTRRKVRDAWDS